MDQRLYEHFQRAQELVDEQEWGEAESLLSRMKSRRLNQYERAQLLNLAGYIDTQQEQYDSAISHYRSVLDTQDLPDGLRQSALRMLMQLTLTEGAYSETVRYADQLIGGPDRVGAHVLATKAQAHFRLEQYSEALDSIRQAISRQSENGRPANESWLLMVNAIHHQRTDYADMAEVLKQLVHHYPRDRYLYNLAAVYGQLDQPKKQLLLLEPLYESGFIEREAQVMHLAHLYMTHDVPVKAANLLDWALTEGILEGKHQHLELFAQAWLAAKEISKAIEPLSVAAMKAETGELYVRLAHVHTGRANWSAAEKALHRGIEKGDLREPGNALVLLGMAQYHQRHYAEAINTFNRARSHTRVADISNQWITFIEEEQRKHSIVNS